MCANCSCTAGFGECCNHVVAILYKIEYANGHGLVDPACTDKACAWNKSTEREVRPRKIRDVDIEKHESDKRTKKRVVQSDMKRNFDVRPKDLQGSENQRLEGFFGQLRLVQPHAVALTCVDPPAEFACPPPLPEIAEKVVLENPDANEQALIGTLTESLAFNKSQLDEIEKSTREQAGSNHWRKQRQGCITGTKIRDVFTRVKSLADRSKKPKMTPMIGKLFKERDIGSLPAVKYGRDHEDDARRSFSEEIVKKHKNGKLLSSGLVVNPTFPFIRVTPDNLFVCSCCKDGPVPVEYKCAYKIRDKTVLEGSHEVDYLVKADNGDLHLKEKHKYYSQVTAQIALLGAKYGYFVVWTPKGEPFIEQIYLNRSHWNDLERNAVIFFKSYVAPVLLKLRQIFYCPECEKPCLEEEEIERDEQQAENSIECSCCTLWFHWRCVHVKTNPKGDWICEGCLKLDDDIFRIY